MSYLDFFKELSAIPRSSGDMERISQYCVDFAMKRNLEYVRDKYNNVVIYKKATEGREGDPAVVLQGHLDMVADKTPESTHDFSKDGIKLIEKDGFLTADGTTLGADDGIGVAYALEVLDNADGSISHPDLTCIFTVDEEIGLDGMRDLDKSLIRGNYVINIDNDIDGTIFTGSAGGRTLDCTLPVNFCITEGQILEVKVTGLKGGHSGAEIDKERANANVVIGRILYEISKEIDIQIIDIKGGSKDNAIAREAVAKLLIHQFEYDKFVIMAKNIEKQLKNEYAHTDGDIMVEVTDKGIGVAKAMFLADTRCVLDFLYLMPNGVYNKTFEPMYMVEASSNAGVMYTDEVSVNVTISVRSNIGSKKELITNKVSALLDLCGGFLSIKNDYPQWEYKAESKLQQVFSDSYKSLTGKELKREAIHAGLECGHLSNYNSDFDIVSMGPAIYDIHTTEETLDLRSAEETFELLKLVLKDIR